jgi:hypothetical protein
VSVVKLNELSGRQPEGTRFGLVKMYRVPPNRA